MSITNRSWGQLSSHLSLQQRLDDGESVVVTADTIKAVTKREPRLMTKFDARAHRPPVLRSATILPIENGKYLIVPGDGYQDFEEVPNPEHRSFPRISSKLMSLPWREGPSSESQLLDMVYASRLLDEFLEESDQYLTVRGRLRSPAFDFVFPTRFGDIEVNVAGVQVEVDGGYEGNSLNLIEAKLGKREDFHVRQIYYPLRMWKERLPSKASQAVFITYSDRVVSLRLYDFAPLSNYGAIELKKAKDYVLEDADEELNLASILNATKPEPAPEGVTFPQADDMVKVLDLVDATAAGVTSLEETTERYGFTERQALYYPTAARYLGFIESGRSERQLTQLGRTFASSSRATRHRLVIERLAALPVFRDALIYTVNNAGTLPSTELVADWIADESSRIGLPLTGSTPHRRAATVRSWIQWAIRAADE